MVGQFSLLLALVVIPAGPGWVSSSWLGIADTAILAIGWLVLIFAGINLGRSLTANPVPLERATLKTNGLYALVRHPIYLALILIALALAIKSESWLGYALLAIFIVLLNLKARFEERLLRSKFAEYGAYAAKVGRLFPGIGRVRD